MRESQTNRQISVVAEPLLPAPRPADERGSVLRFIRQDSDGDPQRCESSVVGKEFAGGEKFEAPAIGTVYSANITPDMETGIGKWSEDFFVKKIHDYRDYVEKGSPRMTGREQFTVMPWLAFCRMSNEELGAIYTYLRTLKPVRNAVETHPKS